MPQIIKTRNKKSIIYHKNGMNKKKHLQLLTKTWISPKQKVSTNVVYQATGRSEKQKTNKIKLPPPPMKNTTKQKHTEYIYIYTYIYTYIYVCVCVCVTEGLWIQRSFTHKPSFNNKEI